MTKQKTAFSKTKTGAQVGFRTSDHFKGKIFGPRNMGARFNPGQFKTQHKG